MPIPKNYPWRETLVWAWKNFNLFIFTPSCGGDGELLTDNRRNQLLSVNQIEESKLNVIFCSTRWKPDSSIWAEIFDWLNKLNWGEKKFECSPSPHWQNRLLDALRMNQWSSKLGVNPYKFTDQHQQSGKRKKCKCVFPLTELLC